MIFQGFRIIQYYVVGIKFILKNTLLWLPVVFLFQVPIEPITMKIWKIKKSTLVKGVGLVHPVRLWGGVDAGNGCVVGAGTVLVGKKYPPFSIIVGCPGKVIKTRTPSKIMHIPTTYNIEELMNDKDINNNAGL